MTAGVAFCCLMILGLSAFSIFRQNPLINACIILLSFGAIGCYAEAGLGQLAFFSAAMAFLIGYHFMRIAKSRSVLK